MLGRRRLGAVRLKGLLIVLRGILFKINVSILDMLPDLICGEEHLVVICTCHIHIQNVTLGNLSRVNRLCIVMFRRNLIYHIDRIGSIHADGSHVTLVYDHLFIHDFAVGQNAAALHGSAVGIDIGQHVTVRLRTYFHAEKGTAYGHHGVGSVYHIAFIGGKGLGQLVGKCTLFQRNHSLAASGFAKCLKSGAAVLFQLYVFVSVKHHAGVAFILGGQSVPFSQMHIGIGIVCFVIFFCDNRTVKLRNADGAVTLLLFAGSGRYYKERGQNTNDGNLPHSF